MMKFIIFLGCVLLFETVSGLNVGEVTKPVTSNKISFLLDYLLQILAPYRNQCLAEDLKKVEQCYEGHRQVFSHFTVPLKRFGESMLTTLTKQIDLLTRLANGSSNSTIVTTGSASILHGMSFLSKLGKNDITYLIESVKSTPRVFAAYRNTVTKLYRQIGRLNRPINDGLRCVQDSSSDILQQFLNRRGRYNKKLNFKPIMKCGRLLANRVAFIAKTALENCDCITFANGAFDSLGVTFSITYESIMSIEGVLSVIADIIDDETGDIPADLLSYIKEVDYFAQGIHTAIISSTSNYAKDVRDFLQTLVDQAETMNTNLAPLLGTVNDIKITTDDVIKNLLKS